MSELTIGAGYVKALLELAVAKGADMQVLVRRADINPDELGDRDTRVPLEVYQALMKTAKDLLDEPALALHLGEAAILSDISIVGLIFNSSETMVEAMAQGARFGRLVVEVDGHRPQGRFAIEREAGKVWLVDTRHDPNSFPELSESAFAMTICSQARDFGHTDLIHGVHFTHEAPEDISEYERIFKVPITFGSDKNALLIDEDFLDLKLSPPNTYVFGIFSTHAEALLQSLQDAKTMRGRIESLLIPVLHTGDVGLQQVADKLGISRQTVYRKLKAEDVTYETLLDELRHKMAMHYLGAKKVSVNETAYLTGFSDPSAFSRAFKRWTGTSPGRASVRGDKIPSG